MRARVCACGAGRRADGDGGAQLRESCVFLKVDVDENEETAGACGISCMPTFQLFKNSEKVACWLHLHRAAADARCPCVLVCMRM